MGSSCLYATMNGWRINPFLYESESIFSIGWTASLNPVKEHANTA